MFSLLPAVALAESPIPCIEGKCPRSDGGDPLTTALILIPVLALTSLVLTIIFLFVFLGHRENSEKRRKARSKLITSFVFFLIFLAPIIFWLLVVSS